MEDCEVICGACLSGYLQFTLGRFPILRKICDVNRCGTPAYHIIPGNRGNEGAEFSGCGILRGDGEQRVLIAPSL